MEFFDLKYFLICKQRVEIDKQILELSDRARTKQRQIMFKFFAEAARIARVVSKDHSVYPYLDLVAESKTIDVLAFAVSKRRYGKGMPKKKEMIIKACAPDESHMFSMNMIRKQIKSFSILRSQTFSLEDHKQKWVMRMSKSNKIRTPSFEVKINFKKVASRYIVPNKIIEECGELLKKVNEISKHKAGLDEKQDQRAAVLEKKQEKTKKSTCAMCLEDDGLVEIKCGHAFHVHCLTELFADMVSHWHSPVIIKCPMCRYILN